MSSHEIYQNQTDEETTNIMDFVGILLTIIGAITLFAAGYYFRAAQDAAWLSEALSK